MRWLSLLASLSAFAACAAEDEPPVCVNEVPMQLQPLADLGYIAHAGGSPRGLQQDEIYTNSREAFEVSYDNGFRAFELDLLTLGDGTVVVAHDGYESTYGLDRPFGELTRSLVEGARWNGKYEILFAEDLIALLVEYPDVWIILDTKWDHVAIAERLVELAPGASVLDRIVPHLSSPEHTEALLDLYAFPERIMAMYRWRNGDAAMIEAMDTYAIDQVMMWFDRRWSEQTQALLDERGYLAWVHTPHEATEIEFFRNRGIGVYSDGYRADCLQIR